MRSWGYSLLLLSKMGTAGMRVSRIERHLKRVAADDEFLRREGFGTRLTEPELREALHERGMYVFSHFHHFSVSHLFITTV
jgi:hypothetical protein